MPDIYWATRAYKRLDGNQPELKLINMFVEEAPTSESQVSILSRQGLLLVTTVGSGPIRAVFSKEGTFGGEVFTVSGTSVYRGSTLLGTLPGTSTAPVSVAASATEVVFAAGSTAKSYNGTNFASITFPDTASVTAVEYVSQLFVFIRAGTDRYYWSAINNGRSIDGLDYASAEITGDSLLDMRVLKGNLFFLGESSVEPWFPTADPDLPFSRINQQVYTEVGVFATNCASVVDNNLYFVGSDGVVYRAEDVPVKISDPGIDERIFQTENAAAFAFTYEGHKFFCIQHDAGTHLYDISTTQWCEFQSYESDRWRASCAVTVGRTALFGDDATGKLWELSGWLDDASAKIERIFTAYFPIKGGGATVHNISMVANTGQTAISSGAGSAPVVQIRASRDAGNTWGSWRSVALGAIGKFRTKVLSRLWGMFDPPGAMFEVKNDDPVPFRVSGVAINENGGGRSRG